MFTTDRSLRRWWPMLAAVPLGALCGGGYALAAPPSYVANAYVMAVPRGGADSAAAVNFAQAYGRIISQPEILLGPAARTGVPLAELTSRVEAVTSPDAPMIQITGTAGRARLAAREANAVATSLVAFGNATTSQTGVQLLPFATAATPATPSSPSRGIDLAVGLAAGLLLGGLVMMARQVPAEAVELSSAEDEGRIAELPQPRPLAEGESVPDQGPEQKQSEQDLAEEGGDEPAADADADAEPDAEVAQVEAKVEAKSAARPGRERSTAKARG
jgi:capsular polysaccharide biosynthesis protein